MKHNYSIVKTTVTVGTLLAAGSLAWADPPFQGTPNPLEIRPGNNWQWPWQAVGKEYVTAHNVNYSHQLEPGRILAWDGIGGIKDSILVPTGGVDLDALANRGDALYREVIANKATLLFSVTGDQPAPPFQPDLNRNHVWYEAPPGWDGVWATTRDINHNLSDAQSLTAGTFDLTGLEVWGPDGIDDTDRYSLVGDPNGIAVYRLDAGSAQPWITSAQIQAAIGSTASVDVDALMVNDNGDAAWDAGDSIMFSIAPNGQFDGGEIWVWDHGQNPYFLNHGGHIWDTAFSVMGAFNVQNENIDALEAVMIPEPASVAMSLCTILLGSGYAYLHRRRNRRS